jgi:hypothetical protein
LKRPGFIQAAPGELVKNLKELWEKSPELLDGIGGERLTGSGFELEQPDIEAMLQLWRIQCW